MYQIGKVGATGHVQDVEAAEGDGGSPSRRREQPVPEPEHEGNPLREQHGEMRPLFGPRRPALTIASSGRCTLRFTATARRRLRRMKRAKLRVTGRGVASTLTLKR